LCGGSANSVDLSPRPRVTEPVTIFMGLGLSPPDGSTIPCGATFTKTWTIRNSGSVPWRGRRLRRIGATVGPWTLASERFTPIPDTEPGETVSISVEIKTPHMETAAVAQWKMVDADDLLYFPSRYSVGLGLYVLVGHEGSPPWTGSTTTGLVG